MWRVVWRSWVLSPPLEAGGEGNGGSVAAVKGGERDEGRVWEVEGRELGSA